MFPTVLVPKGRSGNGPSLSVAYPRVSKPEKVFRQKDKTKHTQEKWEMFGDTATSEKEKPYFSWFDFQECQFWEYFY